MKRIKLNDTDKSRRQAVLVLFVVSILFTLSGVGLSVFSVLYQLKFSLFTLKIHGLFIGLIIITLGVKYLRSVYRMKKSLAST